MENKDDNVNISNISSPLQMSNFLNNNNYNDNRRYQALIDSINCQHDKYHDLPTLFLDDWCTKTIKDFIDEQTEISEKRKFYIKDIISQKTKSRFLRTATIGFHQNHSKTRFS